jgi:hypothetical protein
MIIADRTVEVRPNKLTDAGLELIHVFCDGVTGTKGKLESIKETGTPFLPSAKQI